MGCPGHCTIRTSDDPVTEPGVGSFILPFEERSILEAITAGVGYLMGKRHAGFWQDFTLAPGNSDEWVTGYVGTRLYPITGTSPELMESWEALRARAQWRGVGWSYNGYVPQDADSTSWVLRLAAALDINDDVTDQARESLENFRHENGMFGTYGPTDAIRAFIGATDDRSFAGWTAAHACVTGAAAGLRGIVPNHVLEKCQDPKGNWHSYWWEADAFATALVVESLSEGRARVRGGEWALDQLTSLPGMGPFSIANLIHAACAAGLARDSRVSAAADLLANIGLSDGSWLSDARMRVPDPADQNPNSNSNWIEGGRIEGSAVSDQRRIFTTATTIHALAVFNSSN